MGDATIPATMITKGWAKVMLKGKFFDAILDIVLGMQQV